MDAISVISLIIGALGLAFTIMQTYRIGRMKRRDYMRHWETTKEAQKVMYNIEKIREEYIRPDKDKCGVEREWGRAHEGAQHLVRMALQNLFLLGKKFSDKDLHYLTDIGLLDGYLLKAFLQMRTTPPKEWDKLYKDKMKEMLTPGNSESKNTSEQS